MSDTTKPDPIAEIAEACASCPSRRTFLKVSGGLVTLATAGALSACGDDSGGNVDTLSERLSIAISDHPELATEGSSALINVGLRSPLAVTRTGADEFIVTGTECNHQGCSVGRSGDGWRCPCHGSRFALNGALNQGPATAGLTPYDSEFDGDTLTVIP